MSRANKKNHIREEGMLLGLHYHTEGGDWDGNKPSFA